MHVQLSPIRRGAAALSALLALVVIGQLLGAVWRFYAPMLTRSEAIWFGAWGVLAFLAALAPWFYARAPRLAGWLPYAAAALFLGLVVPGLFSISVHMLVAGLLELLAGWLLAPGWSRVGLVFVVALSITAGLLAWVWLG